MGENTDLLYEQLKKYDFVRFTWPDLNGIQRGVSTARRNVQELLQSGTYAWRGVNALGANSALVIIDDVEAEGHGNMCVKARPGTAHSLTWAGSNKYKVGEVLCNCYLVDGTLMEPCATNAALNQVTRLEKKGYKILSGFELEYTLYNAASQKPAFGGTDIFSQLVFSEVEDYVLDLDKHLEAADVELECLHTEWGAGQLEVTFRPQWGIKIADNVFISKEAAKEIAHQKGYQAVLMAKPEEKAMSNGGHFTHSIWDINGKNMLENKDATKTDNNLSKFGQHWMAGLCKHAQALTVLCSPTTNCFRRLHNPWTPFKVDWGFDNRFSTFRVKLYGSKGGCIENRIPSSACNPYLVLAGTIAAGLDGVENQLECPPPCSPGALLPKNLPDALAALQKDDIIVNAIGKDLVKWFVQMKTDTDLAALKTVNSNNVDSDSFSKEFEFYARLL